MTPEPYENVLLGAFVFGLGRLYEQRAQLPCAAERIRVHPLEDSAIAVLQQTPLDHPLGDLVLRLKGRCLLMEFKRSRHDIASELKKERKAAVVDALNGRSRGWRERSTRLHFLAFGDVRAHGMLRVVPYADARAALASNEQMSYLVSDFGTQLFAADGRVGGSEQDLREYLAFLEQASGSTDTADGLGGFLLSVSRDGTISAFPYEGPASLTVTIGTESLKQEVSQHRSQGMQR